MCQGVNPTNIHGQLQLSESYAVYQFCGIDIEEYTCPALNQDHLLQMKISSNYSVTKALVSIFQIFYGSFELYRTRGGQLDNYGYGAYSLIVIPFVFMSFVNLVAALSSPEYPLLFLVESPMSDEAKARGSILSGMVGRVTCPLSKQESLPLQSCDLDVDETASTHEQASLVDESSVRQRMERGTLRRRTTVSDHSYL